MACSVSSCGKPSRSLGLCLAHYKRQRRHGDPTAGAMRNHAPLEERIAAGMPADLTLFGCWEWRRGKTATGYGAIALGDGKTGQAHRVVYEALVGPVPVGLELDHLCRNRACVNPAHLEPVTRAENVRRGWPYRADWKGVA